MERLKLQRVRRAAGEGGSEMPRARRDHGEKRELGTHSVEDMGHRVGL